jgi:hypothetical protein
VAGCIMTSLEHFFLFLPFKMLTYLLASCTAKLGFSGFILKCFNPLPHGGRPNLPYTNGVSLNLKRRVRAAQVAFSG